MKTLILSAMTLMTAFSCNHAQTQGVSSEKKVLVAYFSYSGNTQSIAEHISALTDGELFRIETEKTYPTEYKSHTEVAKQERDQNARPALKTKLNDIAQYDVIFVGCPSWWHTAPMAVLTFLESYDFAGKTVIPFCTHESKEDGAFAAIEKATPGAKHLKGFDIFGTKAKDARPEVEQWLRKIQVL